MSYVEPLVQVSELDRTAAAKFGRDRLFSSFFADRVLNGEEDHCDLVQAFARHRIEGTAVEVTT